MTEARKTIRLYEALELRGEYDARIKTLRDCLPEARQNRNLFSHRDNDSSRRPAPGFSVSEARDQRRKLNAAIQRANFEHRVEHEGDDMSLTEALETRKALNDRLGELHTQVVDSAYERVLHKEERDIVEDNELPYDDCRTRLNEARVEFRQLNRQIRAASFEVEVEYADE
ncbi:MAG: hypothetical protein J4F35_21065 [Candidatus Latescibacteria bacterium]|nr:hypothetical protein [Candidatus Latescibacterota bacterium]